MIFIDINEYLDKSAISEYDLLIVDSIHILNNISEEYNKIEIILVKELIDNLIYQEKIIDDIKEKIILLDIIIKKYPNIEPEILLNKFLLNRNNPFILNKNDILIHINTLYNQYLKDNKLSDYTIRIKKLINSNFENKFNKIIFYGDFLNLNELEWDFLRKYFDSINKLEIISNYKDEIIKSFYNKNYSHINKQNKNFIGFYPFAKFICNLIKTDTNLFLEVKKLLEQNLISLKEIKLDNNIEITFEGNILNFEQEEEINLIEILNNIEKSGVKILSEEENVINRIENYFYLRKQYAMDNEISEQKYEKDFYKTIIGWKILEKIVSKINYFLNNKESFNDFYNGIRNLISFLGIDNSYKDEYIYDNTLNIFKNLSSIFDKSDYIFDRNKLYIFLKSILESTIVKNHSYINNIEVLNNNRISDYYKKNNYYHSWSEYEGHLLNIRNDTITDFYTSVTQIEEFSMCPMKYFFNRKLKIRNNLLVDNDLDPILRGNLLHKILETFYIKISQEDYFNSENINLLSDYCKNIMIKVCDEFFEPYNNIMDNLYLQKVKNELLDGLNKNKYKKGIIYKVLEKDNSRLKEGWKPSEFERKFIIEINGLNFSGSIDRIDINSNNEFEILDYKTGNIFLNYKKSEIVTGSSFQLPIYTIAYEKETNKKFSSSSYFVLKENSYLDVNIYPIIDKSNYNFLINKTLDNLDKVKDGLLYSKYNYTTGNTERICKSCDYRHICRINPLKSYYMTNKIDRPRKIFNFINNNTNNNFFENINNKNILIITNLNSNIKYGNNNISKFKDEKDFLIKFIGIYNLYDENKNNYLIDKYIEELIDKLSYKKDKYLELLLNILDRKQIINFISNIIKSNELDFYINSNFEDIWKNYTKKYLYYAEYILNKLDIIELKIKDIPKIGNDIKKYHNNVTNTISKIRELINIFKIDKNNFYYVLDIKKSEQPVYSRNIEEYINVQLHGEIINTIYFGEYSLINIFNKFQYFSIEKEYIRAFYKIINDIGKLTYDWKNKNNIFTYDDIIKKIDTKSVKNKILSKFDLIIKDTSSNYLDRILLKNELNLKNSLIFLNKDNKGFKVHKSILKNENIKINIFIARRKLDNLMIIPEIIYQFKNEAKSIGIITNDDRKLKIISELFSKKRIKYTSTGYNLLNFQEISDIINVLEFINNKEKYIELIGVLRSPIFCLNDTEIYNLTHHSEDLISSLNEIYPQIYSKIKNWIDLSSYLKIDDLIKFIVEDSKIRDYINLYSDSHIKNKNINKLIKIASENNDCILSEFITIIRNCKYLNNTYINDNTHINIMTVEEAQYRQFDTLIYLDLDDVFSNQLDDILIEKNNNMSYIAINIPLLKSNNTSDTLIKLMFKQKYEEKILEKVSQNIDKITSIINTTLIFITNSKISNSKLFNKYLENEFSNINKIYI